MKQIQLYYYSEEGINRLHPDIKSPLKKIIETEEIKQKTEGELEAKVSLPAKLVTSSVKGKKKNEKGHSITTQTEEKSEDRVHNIVDKLFPNCRDIKQYIQQNGSQDSIYSFNLSLNLESKEHRSQDGIHVWADLGDFRIEGFTTLDGWTKPVLNNVTLKNAPLPAAGIIIPMPFDEQSSPPVLTVQFIAIFNPTSSTVEHEGPKDVSSQKKIEQTDIEESKWKRIKIISIIIVFLLIGGFVSFWLFNDKEQTSIETLPLRQRTDSIRSILEKGSIHRDTTLFSTTVPVWSPPNNQSIKFLDSLATISPINILHSLIILLSDTNVTVSSGALISLSNILEKTIAPAEKQKYIELINQHQWKVNLSGASLQHQDFRILYSTTIFTNSNLSYADFSYCRFDSVSFQKAIAINTNFSHSNLSYSNFEGARLDSSLFIQVQSSYTSYKSASLMAVDFSNILKNDSVCSNLEKANFADAQIDGANFSCTRIGGANFNRAFLSRTSFLGAYLYEVNQDSVEAYIRSQKPTSISDCIFQKSSGIVDKRIGYILLGMEDESSRKWTGLVIPKESIDSLTNNLLKAAKSMHVFNIYLSKPLTWGDERRMNDNQILEQSAGTTITFIERPFSLRKENKVQHWIKVKY
jgi:uncharacterized protein YjbI with pentapeptide repeats